MGNSDESCEQSGLIASRGGDGRKEGKRSRPWKSWDE